MNTRPCKECGRPIPLSRQKSICHPCKYNKAKVFNVHKVCLYCQKDSTQTRIRPGRNICFDCHAARERQRTAALRVGPPPCPVCETNPVEKKHDGMCLSCYAMANEFDAYSEEAM